MVEKWLLQVEEAMVASVKKVIGEAFDAYSSTPRKEWVVEWPGQIVVCIGAAFWTAEVTASFKSPLGLNVNILNFPNIVCYIVFMFIFN